MPASWLARIVGRLPRSWIKAVARLQWRGPRAKWLFDWIADRLRNQDGVVQQGVGQGLRFNPGRSNAGYLLGTSEPGLQEAFVRLTQTGMTVYDVGANVGFFTVLSARLVGPGGLVISFEPLAANARLIAHNVALNEFRQVLVRQEALGREDGEARFLVSAVPSWGKLATAGDVSRQIGEETVAVRRLDTLIAEQGLRPPDLIKLDVEGAECDALEGAGKTIAAVRPLLLIELHGTNTEVARVLSELRYVATVLGSQSHIAQAPWNAHVVGTPVERNELSETLAELSRLDLER